MKRLVSLLLSLWLLAWPGLGWGAYGEIQPDGTTIVGLWHLDDLTDASGNGFTLSVGGSATTVPGIFGDAYSFNGTTDYLTATDDGTLDFEGSTEDFTVTAWINPDSITTHQAIVYRFDENDDFWRVHLWSDNKITASLNAIDFSSATGVCTVDEWTFIAAVFNKSGNGQIYIDGIASGSSVALNNEVLDISSTTLHIGIGIGSSHEWDGQIEEVVIYDRVLFADEIRQIYAMQKGKFGVIE